MTTITHETASAELTIRLFGPMQVLLHGNPLPHLRSRKSLYLLALLTLRHNRSVEREWLAGTLWPDVDQTQAFANLRPALSGLRDALGAAAARLESPGRRTLRLNLAAGADVDLLTFDAAVASGERKALEQAIRVYRGPLLEGFAEEWIVQDRMARERDCLRALQTLASAAFAAGDAATAANYWRRAVSLDPLWDAARRGLMESLVRDGDSNAALQVYREFDTALKSGDMRAVPDAETTALYRRLREQIRQKANAIPTVNAEEATPPISGYLPYALTELVGREDERLEVAERLRRSRLVTLTGPGGIGKTRLAAAVAGEVAREYPDGVWLVPLESLRAESGDEGSRALIQQIASVLGIKESTGRPLLTLVTEQLRRKRLLLVLDNCEHVLEATAQTVAPLLRECLGVRILATSREALRISGETVWTVPALAVPEPERLPAGQMSLIRAIAGYDAVRLFVERAEAAHKTFALTGGNARDVALLCSRLEGVPLALELAAARAVALTPAQILAQWDARPLDALASRHRDVAPRHRTLRATLEWSYNLLPPEAQAFLNDIGVFRGSFTLEAAQAVCPDADAAEMLTLLSEASLINATGDAGERRFNLLETVRQFAAESLEKSGSADATRQRHSRYYAAWVGERFSEWGEKREREAQRFFALIEREYPNVSASLVWASEADEDTLLQFAYHLAVFWARTGRIQEGRSWLRIVPPPLPNEEAEEADSAPDEEESAALKARLNRYRAIQDEFLFIIGDYDTAAVRCLHNFELAQRAGNAVSGRTFLFNAASLTIASDLKRALEMLEQCLPLEREHRGDGRANPVIFSQLAVVARFVGQTEAAAHFLSEALTVCHGNEENDPQGYARAMWVAGDAALAENDFPLALERFDTTMAVARRLGDISMTTDVLCSMAALAHEMGDSERETSLVTQAGDNAGPEPSFWQSQMLRLRRIESLWGSGDRAGAAALTREGVNFFRGKARSFRLFVYPLLLLLTEAEFTSGKESSRAEKRAQLLGAAGGVAARLGLLAPTHSDRKRAERLHRLLIEQLGPERFAREEAAGAALDDEGTLEFALSG